MAYIYKRGRYWHVGYKSYGKTIRKSLKVTSREAAKTLLAEYQTLEARERNRSTLLTVRRKLSDIVGEYLIQTSIGRAPLTGKEKRSAIGRFQDFIGDQVRSIDEISSHHIETYFNQRLNGTIQPRNTNGKKGSVAGANKDLKVIKAFLNYAVKKNYLHDNPARAIRKIKTIKKIFRDLSFEEVGRLLETAKDNYPYLYPIIAGAYYLGFRDKELVYLEWADVDLDKNSVYVRTKPENRVKDCEERVVPLNSKIRGVLAELPRNGRFVFTNPSGSVWKNNLYREFQKAVRVAGLQDVSMQTLRETFGSHLLRRGVSIYLVSKYLGHSSVDVTTRHYAHVPIEMTHDEINVL